MSIAVALSLLRKALNNPSAEFRDGQWEAIEKLTVYKQKLLVIERTGWGKSSVYYISTKILQDQGKGMSDSRWTFTISSVLLKKAGSGPVYPVALTSTSVSD